MEGVCLNGDVPTFNTYVTTIFSPDNLTDSRIIGELFETDLKWGLRLYALSSDGSNPGSGTTLYARTFQQYKEDLPSVSSLEQFFAYTGGAQWAQVGIDSSQYTLGSGSSSSDILIGIDDALDWLLDNTGIQYSVQSEVVTPLKYRASQHDAYTMLALEYSNGDVKFLKSSQGFHISCMPYVYDGTIKVNFTPSPAEEQTSWDRIQRFNVPTIDAQLYLATNNNRAFFEIPELNLKKNLWALGENSPVTISDSL